jgi:hypothetical protein
MKRKTDSPTACARHSVDPVTKVGETFADYMKEFAKKGSAFMWVALRGEWRQGWILAHCALQGRHVVWRELASKRKQNSYRNYQHIRVSDMGVTGG